MEIDSTLIIFIAGGIVLLVLSIVIVSFFNTWLKALLSRAPVGFPTLLAMRLRGVPVGEKKAQLTLCC